MKRLLLKQPKKMNGPQNTSNTLDMMVIAVITTAKLPSKLINSYGPKKSMKHAKSTNFQLLAKKPLSSEKMKRKPEVKLVKVPKTTTMKWTPKKEKHLRRTERKMSRKKRLPSQLLSSQITSHKKHHLEDTVVTKKKSHGSISRKRSWILLMKLTSNASTLLTAAVSQLQRMVPSSTRNSRKSALTKQPRSTKMVSEPSTLMNAIKKHSQRESLPQPLLLLSSPTLLCEI